LRVAVVILNWNGKRFLEKFLPSLIRFSAPDAGIVVADNASTDDSVSFLKSEYPEIRIIQNKDNGGFARGYNLALRQVNAEYFILLNSDIEVTGNWISPVIALMDRNQQVGACQPKIRSYHDPKRFEYAGAAGGYIDSFGYPFCRGRILLHIEEDYGQYDDQAEIFWASGACMFVRSSLYHQLGGFDEDFFAHMEEIDFCWRLKNCGYKVMYCPSSTVFHIGGGTLPKISWRKTYLNFRNNLFLLYKNLPGEMLFPVFASRLALDGIAAMKFLFTAGFKDFWAVVKAYVSFYSSLSKLREKRKTLNHPSSDQIYSGNIVFCYYLLGKQRFNQLNPSRFLRKR
jgi:GT2 family glycosyltransferase